jgi:hypothetical protein
MFYYDEKNVLLYDTDGDHVIVITVVAVTVVVNVTVTFAVNNYHYVIILQFYHNCFCCYRNSSFSSDYDTDDDAVTVAVIKKLLS